MANGTEHDIDHAEEQEVEQTSSSSLREGFAQPMAYLLQ